MKARWKKLVAGLLCGVVLCTGTGLEQAVRAEAAEDTDVLEEVQEIQEPEADADETEEQTEAEDDNSQEPEGGTGFAEEESKTGESDAVQDTENQTESDFIETQENADGASTVVISGDCGDDGDNVKYVLDSDGVLTISGSGGMYSWDAATSGQPWYNYRSSIKIIVIENGVTSIGDYAFHGCSDLTSVSIPDSVTSIGYRAFYYCSVLRSVSIPSSVTSIGDYAFWGCSGLTSVNIPSGITSIGIGVFEGCRNLTNVNIPSGVTSIGGSAFNSCSGLTSVNIPSGVTSIGNYAFRDCSSLTSVSIPMGVTSIGKSAFKDCSSLTKVSIPSSVTSVGASPYYGSVADCAFCGCMGLKTAGPIGGGYNYEFGWTKGIPDQAFGGCYGLKTVIFPTDMTWIGKWAFYGCRSVTNISLPSSVATVGREAFVGCTGLKTAGPAGGGYNYEFGWKEIIPSGAFCGCSGLTSISLPADITSIDIWTFRGCSSLTSINLPVGITSIGFWAFDGCSGLTSIKLPSGLKHIDGEAFRNCSGLTRVSIPLGVMDIGESAFKDCSKLANVSIPSSVTSIGSNAFSSCSASLSVQILNPTCNISSYAFPSSSKTTIYGYANSTAEAYAIKNNQIFKPLTPVTIAKDMTAEEVLKELDINNLINNISLSGIDIDGPVVTIAGKTFSLFTVPTSMDIKLGDKVQAKVDEDKKTIQVLIGFDDFNGSAKLDSSENSSTYWSESYRQVKSLYTEITGNKVDSTKLWNKFSKLRGKLKKINCSMGISASASAAGYIEFNYASGEIVYSSGGVILEADFGMSINYKFPPCPAVYVTFGVDTGFDGKLSFIRESALNYTPAMTAGIDLAAALGTGAGSKKLNTYAEIGLKGTLGIKVSVPADSLTDALLVDLTAYAYFKSQVFGFDGPDWGPEYFPKIQLYPKSNSRSYQLFNGRDLADFNFDTAVPSDRSYLGKSDAFNSNEKNVLYSKSNLYRYNDPQLVCLNDGTMLLIWIDDNGNKSDVNKTSLMYAVYNGFSWSEAKAIEETGGANDYPSIWSDGKKVQIVWQKAEKLPDDAGLSDVLQSVELYTVTYQDGMMGKVMAITSENLRYEMMQSIAVNGEQMAVAWMENSENDPFQADGTNMIKVSRYENGGWTESTIASSQAEVSNLNASYVGTDLIITYESVVNGKNIITVIKGNEKKDIEGYSAEVSGGILYYCKDDELTAYDMETEVTENILPVTMGDFTVLDNGIEKMIVTTEYTGYTSELVAYIFDRLTGHWSEKVTLTKEGKYIRDYSSALDSNGSLFVALNLIDVDENSDVVYGDSELCVMSFSGVEDLIMEEGVYYDKDALKSGGKLPLNFRVTNNGTKMLSEIYVDILDSSGRILQSGVVNSMVGVGETTDISYIYTLPETVLNQVLTIKAYAMNEVNLSDNTTSVEIGEPDIAVGNLYLSKETDNTIVLNGEIRNIGYREVPEVTVTVYDGNEEGNIIGTTMIAGPAVSGSGTFSVVIPEIYLDVSPLASGNILYVVASTDSDEMDYENNTDSYLVQSADDEPLVMNFKELILKTGEREKLEVTFSKVTDIVERTILWKSSAESVVTVADGNLTAISAGRATITAMVGEYTASCVVTVKENISVTGIYLDTSSIWLAAGESRQLIANVLPTDAVNQKVVWESADSNIASVDAKGLVSAVTAGITEIRVYTEEGYKVAVCKVTVIQEAVYRVTFSGGNGTLGENPPVLSGFAGTEVILPENPYIKEGYLFEGWTDGERMYAVGASYKIPYCDVVLTALWSEKREVVYTISSSAQEGGNIIPSGDVTVMEGKNQKFIIAADEGYYVSGIKVDGENINVVSEYLFKNVLENHTIEVLFAKISHVKVEKINLNQTNVTLQKGTTVLLEAIVYPENAEDKRLTWVSDNPDVAAVDSDGLITAISVGNTVITVTAGEINTCCMVTVIDLQEDPDHPAQPAYTVTFNLQGKGTALEEYAGYTDITPGSTIQEPAAPAEKGYQFTGWYKDAECTEKWDFTKDVVNADTTLYAGWEEIPAGDEGGVLPGDEPADGRIPDGIWMADIGEYTYTGAAVTPEVRVYNHDRRLVKGKDYTVSYKNNKKAAKSGDKKAPAVIVKGIGNYTGTVSRTFTIKPAELTEDCLIAADDYYAGSAYVPVVMLDGNILKAKTDYTLTYYDDSNGKKLKKQPVTEGSYSMHIAGKGSCTNEITFHYTIVKDGRISIAKGKAAVPSMVYGGAEPAVSLTVGGQTLVKETDYTVRFTNTGAKGTATVIFTGTGKYTGVLKKTCKVSAAPLPEHSVSVSESAAAYEKGGAKAEVAVTVNGTKLTEGIDYTVTYKGNTKIGSTAQVTVKGKGNYKGTVSDTFKVTEKDLASEGVQIYVSDAVTGKKPAVMIYDTNGRKLTSGSDYIAKTDTAAHTVTVTGGKNKLYTVKTPIVREYRELEAGKAITSVSFNKRADGFPKNFQYTTNGINLDKGWLNVKAGKKLLPAGNFEVIGYINNASKGTATAIIQGNGEYGGTKALNFKIQSRSIR